MAISVRDVRVIDEEQGKDDFAIKIFGAIHELANSYADGFTAVVKFESASRISFTVVNDKNYKKYGRYVVAFTHLTEEMWGYWVSYSEFMLAYLTAYQYMPIKGYFAVSGWKDKEKDVAFVDIGVITDDIETAKKIAEIFGQKAIWDMETKSKIQINDSEIITKAVIDVEQYLVEKRLLDELKNQVSSKI
jgi:hypothetical protein